jgi:carbamoyltransferase
VLRDLGHGHIQPRAPGAPITGEHHDVAAYLQYSLETTLRRWVGEWSARYGTRRLCLTGGVAQNCRANAELGVLLGRDHVYASPFAGDVGQCVGNALHARSLDLPGAPRPRLANLFLGPVYDEADHRAALAQTPFAGQRMDDDALAERCAEAVMAGRVVAICRGRSEFGPRALGHRSVIGDPTVPGVAERIKRAVKRRDEFMPLAPIVDTQLAAEWGQAPLSETMVFAPEAPKATHGDLGECLHVDRTARVQVATPAADLFAPVLRAFRARTGRGALINTSFNRRGRPMVETPADALAAFAELDIDVLILGPYWIDKAET